MGVLTTLWQSIPSLTSRSLAVEPFPYRAWKWLWQRRGKRGWKSDLFKQLKQSDWDLLIILDACRFDVLAETVDCAVVQKARSPASATPQFLQRAREDGVFENTTYISANPQSGKHQPAHSFTHIPLYESKWDEGLFTVSPESVYDEAKTRLAQGDKVVAHTLQPHYPHICELGEQTTAVPHGLHPNHLDLPANTELSLQSVLLSEKTTLENAKRSYDIAVNYAWGRAKNVVENLTSDGYHVVITADHGELFGEYGFVEHPVDVPVPTLIDVPWIEFRPESETSDQTQEHTTVSDRLSALGYRE